MRLYTAYVYLEGSVIYLMSSPRREPVLLLELLLRE